MIKTCDICNMELDTSDMNDDFSYKNYSIIRVRMENRNPGKRAEYSSEGSLIVCSKCMSKYVQYMPFGEIMDRMVERVNKE